MSTSQRLRNELYDSRVSNSSSSFIVCEFDGGRVTKNERNCPAYVLVIGLEDAGRRGSAGGASFEVDATISRVLEGEEGIVGREGVRSTVANSRVVDWLAIEESVLDRASIRFASFVGDEAGDAGAIASRIPDRSRANLAPFAGNWGWENEGFASILTGLRGEVYVTLVTFAVAKPRKACSSASVSVSETTSVCAGDKSRAVVCGDTFRRFAGVVLVMARDAVTRSEADRLESCLRFIPERFP